MRLRPFRAVYPNKEFITSNDSFFATVKKDYPEFVKSGFFQKTAQDSFYVYRIKDNKNVYTGLIATADISDYLEGKIKKHENTLPAKEQQQLHLIIQRNAMVKPILITYPTVKAITDFINSFTKKKRGFFSIKFEEEKQQHTFWEVREGADIQKMQTLFKKHVPESYIADGHHRSSTTAILNNRNKKHDHRYNSLLCALFPSDQLDIHDYNRVLEEFHELSPTYFMAQISRLFDIKFLPKGRKPKEKHELTMFFNREWYSLVWKKEILKQYKNENVVLDALLLDQLVLNDILGITEVKTDRRIKYVEGPNGIEGVRNKTLQNEHNIGFCLYPVVLEDLFTIADEGKIMPPKSTWFEPRMRNGMIVQEF